MSALATPTPKDVPSVAETINAQVLSTVHETVSQLLTQQLAPLNQRLDALQAELAKKPPMPPPNSSKTSCGHHHHRDESSSSSWKCTAAEMSTGTSSSLSGTGTSTPTSTSATASAATSLSASAVGIIDSDDNDDDWALTEKQKALSVER